MRVLIASVDSDIGAEIAEIHRERGDEVVTTSRNGNGNYHMELLDASSWYCGPPNTWDRAYYTMGVHDGKKSRAETMLINAFMPFDYLNKLQSSMRDSGRVCVLTSGWGSIKLVDSDNNPSYRMSKAALNMGVSVLAKRWKRTHWLLMQPGYIKTKINNVPGDTKHVDKNMACRGIVNTTDKEEQHFTFRDYRGHQLEF